MISIDVRNKDAVITALNIIQDKGVIIYPTDTIYGFGVDATNDEAIHRLNIIKGRSGPMSVLVPDEDTAHIGLSQLGPASRRACMGAVLTAGTTILEPMLAIEVRVPTDLVGNVATVLSGKRGKVLDMQQKGASSIIIGEIPASETFTLSDDMRGQTQGRATWNTSFKAWSEVPKSMFATAIADIRKRKGLAPDPPGISEFIDKE